MTQYSVFNIGYKQVISALQKFSCIMLMVLLFSNLLFSQEGKPCPACKFENLNMLAWFITKQKEECSTDGSWVDYGPDDLKLYTSTDCTPTAGYENHIYDMNFNPALYFEASDSLSGNGSSLYEFQTKSHRSVDVSVFAVMVPRERQNPNEEEWGLDLPDLKRVRSLSIDSMRIKNPSLYQQAIDYGDKIGSDLLISMDDTPEDEYDREKYGKIITYQTSLRPNRTITGHQMMKQVFQIFSLYTDSEYSQNEGQVPEFLVFNKILDETERLKVETYLAVKYGISKEEDYIACNNQTVWHSGLGQNYNFRKTGISYEKDWDLNQSKSTSYYEEETSTETGIDMWKGRDWDVDFFDTEQDFSKDSVRLLTIGIEDESQTIRDAWGPDYHIWGDNNLPLAQRHFNCDAYTSGTYVNRIWRMQLANAATPERIDELSQIRWLNWSNMKNEDGTFYKYHQDPNRAGFCASTTEILREGSFSVKLTDLDFSAGSIIGFSSDNMEFLEEADPTYTGFLFAIRFVNGGNANVVWDSSGDGHYNMEQQVSVSVNTILTFNFTRNLDATYTFSVNSTGSLHETFTSAYKCSGAGGVFAKMILHHPEFGVKVMGPDDDDGDYEAEGFEQSYIKGTNVEYSFSRIDRFMELDELNLTPVLFIDPTNSNGPGFNFARSRKIRGKYSFTPNGYGNRIEFTNVQWRHVNKFTLGFIECENELEVYVDDCCIDPDENDIYVEFKATACLEDDKIYYSFTKDENKDGIADYGEQVFSEGFITSNECISLGDYQKGNYILEIFFEGCDIITKEIIIDNSSFLPELNLPEGPICLESDPQCILPGYTCYCFDELIGTDFIITDVTSVIGEGIINPEYPHCVYLSDPTTYTFTISKEECDEICFQNNDCTSFELDFSGCCNDYNFRDCNDFYHSGDGNCISEETLTLCLFDNISPAFEIEICGEVIYHTIFDSQGNIVLHKTLINNLDELEISTLGLLEETYTIIFDFEDGECGCNIPSFEFCIDECIPAISFEYEEKITLLNFTCVVNAEGKSVLELEFNPFMEIECICCSLFNIEFHTTDEYGNAPIIATLDGIPLENLTAGNLKPQFFGCGAETRNLGMTLDPCQFESNNEITITLGFPDIRNFGCQYINGNPFEDLPIGVLTITEDMLLCCQEYTDCGDIEIEPCTSPNETISEECGEKCYTVSGLPNNCTIDAIIETETGNYIDFDFDGSTLIPNFSGFEEGDIFLIIFNSDCECDPYLLTLKEWLNHNPFSNPVEKKCYHTNELDDIEVNQPFPGCTFSWFQIRDNGTLRDLGEGNDLNNEFFAIYEGFYCVEVSCYNSNCPPFQDCFEVSDDCDRMPERLLIENLECETNSENLRLSIIESEDSIKYIYVTLWQLDEGEKEELVYQKILRPNDIEVISDLEIGEYDLQMIDNTGFSDTQIIEIKAVKSLPSNIIDEEEYILEAGQPVNLDASRYVEHDTEYKWYRNGNYFRKTPTLKIWWPGEYRVVLTTEDCVAEDVVHVVRPSNTLYFDDIDLRFKNPIFSYEKQMFIINNYEEQDHTDLEIFTLDGRQVYSAKFENIKSKVFERKMEPGMYLVRVSNSSGMTIVKKLIVHLD